MANRPEYLNYGYDSARERFSVYQYPESRGIFAHVVGKVLKEGVQRHLLELQPTLDAFKSAGAVKNNLGGWPLKFHVYTDHLEGFFEIADPYVNLMEPDADEVGDQWSVGASGLYDPEKPDGVRMRYFDPVRRSLAERARVKDGKYRHANFYDQLVTLYYDAPILGFRFEMSRQEEYYLGKPGANQEFRRRIEEKIKSFAMAINRRLWASEIHSYTFNDGSPQGEKSAVGSIPFFVNGLGWTVIGRNTTQNSSDTPAHLLTTTNTLRDPTTNSDIVYYLYPVVDTPSGAHDPVTSPGNNDDALLIYPRVATLSFFYTEAVALESNTPMAVFQPTSGTYSVRTHPFNQTQVIATYRRGVKETVPTMAQLDSNLRNHNLSRVDFANLFDHPWWLLPTRASIEALGWDTLDRPLVIAPPGPEGYPRMKWVPPSGSAKYGRWVWDRRTPISPEIFEKLYYNVTHMRQGKNPRIMFMHPDLLVSLNQYAIVNTTWFSEPGRSYGPVDFGREVVRYKDCVIYTDMAAPEGVIYFLDMDNINLCFDTQNFDFEEFPSPNLMRLWRGYFYMKLMLFNARTHGILWGVKP